MASTVHSWFARDLPRNETDQRLFWLAWLLHIPLPFYLLYAIANGDWRNIVGNILAIIVALVPRWMESRSRFHFPAVGEFAISLTLLVEMTGRTFHLYERFKHYDTFAHTLEIGAICGFLVLLLYAFFFEYDVDYDGWFIFVASVGFGLAIGGAWEIFEWIIDLLFDAGYQAGLQDTMIDLTAGAIGAFLATFVARHYRRSHSREEVMKELPIFYEWF